MIDKMFLILGSICFLLMCIFTPPEFKFLAFGIGGIITVLIGIMIILDRKKVIGIMTAQDGNKINITMERE